MDKLILVTGLIPYDSGKTWFVLSSASYARSTGLRVGVFKPVAGHNLWYSPRTIKKSIELGLLVGNDVTLYYENGFVKDPALNNPLAIATIPPDPRFYEQSMDTYMADLESMYSTAVLSRITNCRSKATRHYYYPESLKRAPPATRRTLEKMLLALHAEESSIDELVKYMESANSEESLNECLELIRGGNNVVFIESFNDAIAPYASLLGKVNAIVVVAPGRVFVYEDVKTLKELVVSNVEKYGWEGFRTRHIIGKVSAQITLSTGFALKPKPYNIHKAFIKAILEE
ncbi:MAG: hypothetical protein QW432_03575 [Desulfurococcaceae archaeon]